MNKLLLSLAMFSITGSIMAQKSEERSLEGFSKIRIAGNSSVHLIQSPQQKVRVETEDELSDVITQVNNGTLKIDGEPSVIYINSPEINEISISGTGKVTADSMMKTQDLKLTISGNGKVSMPVQVQSIHMDVTGYGKVKLSGIADGMNVNVSGNSVLDAENLVVKNALMQVSGVSKANVDVRDTLDFRVSGVGSVYYKSEPAVMKREVDGIGKYGFIKRDDSDTTSVQLGKKRVIIIGSEKNDDDDDDDEFDVDIRFGDEDKPKLPKRSRSHWAGFDIGFNGYFHDRMSTDLPSGYDFMELKEGKSIAVGINIWKFDIPLYKRYIMLTTGIGMTLNNYRFSSDRTLISDTSRLAASYDYKETGEQINYAKNKLAVNYVTVPVLLQFNTHRLLKKSVHLGAGMLFSYKYNSHLKLVYEENGDKQKSKRRDDFNIEPFRYDATVRLGYRNYTLFGSYAISELFKKGSGPTLHPFTIGLQLAGW